VHTVLNDLSNLSSGIKIIHPLAYGSRRIKSQKAMNIPAGKTAQKGKPVQLTCSQKLSTEWKYVSQ